MATSFCSYGTRRSGCQTSLPLSLKAEGWMQTDMPQKHISVYKNGHIHRKDTSTDVGEFTSTQTGSSLSGREHQWNTSGEHRKFWSQQNIFTELNTTFITTRAVVRSTSCPGLWLVKMTCDTSLAPHDALTCTTLLMAPPKSQSTLPSSHLMAPPLINIANPEITARLMRTLQQRF